MNWPFRPLVIWPYRSYVFRPYFTSPVITNSGQDSHRAFNLMPMWYAQMHHISFINCTININNHGHSREHKSHTYIHIIYYIAHSIHIHIVAHHITHKVESPVYTHLLGKISWLWLLPLITSYSSCSYIITQCTFSL